MSDIKSIIEKNTSLKVEVLTCGYDDTKQLHYACCLYDAILCHIEISKDETEIVICTDDKRTLKNISEILKNRGDDQNNNNIVTCCNVFYSSTNNTDYYMYRYMIRYFTQ